MIYGKMDSSYNTYKGTEERSRFDEHTKLNYMIN